MPSWFYGPNEQKGIFDECPNGWAEHPSKVKAKADPFDHDGDGKPGGSLPKAQRKPARKAVKRVARK